MGEKNGKIPRPEEVEKDISEFLSKKYGTSVQVIGPFPQVEETDEPIGKKARKGPGIQFDIKPEELTAYLDQYIIKQDAAKAVLATKICTHYNRISRAASQGDFGDSMVGAVKNNVLLMGPTGVGKTYMLKLIAKRLGVPFVKGDATKFSETGYVGGDVEDLVRDLVREADDDIEKARYGIIYIDEIDKIASSGHAWGADVSRTGVQRALLKPMEETDVPLKVPHDPISMMQEMERFRRSGERTPARINTKNILFIMSGAFNSLGEIVRKRVSTQGIGFGACVNTEKDCMDYLAQVKAEDLIAYGFESEFIGRLPIIAVLEKLTESDLFDILNNPNNPFVLNKKLDFAAYGIDLVFTREAIEIIAKNACQERTGARGLVSALERVLLPFEKRLPTLGLSRFVVSQSVALDPEKALAELSRSPAHPRYNEEFRLAKSREHEAIASYLSGNQAALAERFSLKLTESRKELVAALYCKQPTDLRSVLNRVRRDYSQVRKLELDFFKDQGISIAFDDDAVDMIILQHGGDSDGMEKFYGQLTRDFEYGLKLIKEKTGKSRFFLTTEALADPEAFVAKEIRDSKKEPDSANT
jgi:endopeptidase Clp ATP-binding regulatory subunit ClpX